VNVANSVLHPPLGSPVPGANDDDIELLRQASRNLVCSHGRATSTRSARVLEAQMEDARPGTTRMDRVPGTSKNRQLYGYGYDAHEDDQRSLPHAFPTRRRLSHSLALPPALNLESAA
jgi:hypothetical protein